jgi:hypothetical protein
MEKHPAVFPFPWGCTGMVALLFAGRKDFHIAVEVPQLYSGSSPVA